MPYKDPYSEAAKASNRRKTRKYAQANPDVIKAIAKRKRIKYKDNITLTQWLARGGQLPTRAKPTICDVCRQLPTSKYGIVYDHDHSTGKFRGWLCGHCNIALGFAKDSPLTLRLLAEYLETQN